MDEKKDSKLRDKLSKYDTKKRIKMPDGSMMTQAEIDEKYGEMTPNIGMPRKKMKKMPTMMTGKRG